MEGERGWWVWGGARDRWMVRWDGGRERDSKGGRVRGEGEGWDGRRGGEQRERVGGREERDTE